MTVKTAKLGTAIAACVLVITGPVMAQTTANITIDGTFVPPSCAVTIAGGGTLDWGTLTRATVLAYANFAGTAAKLLPLKTGQINVTCPNATVVGLEWTDNRAPQKLVLNSSDVGRFGLGNSNQPSQALGGYEVIAGTVTSTTGGAVNTTFLQPATGGAWSTTPPAAGQTLSWAVPGYVTAYGRSATSTTAPVPLLDLAIPFTVQLYVSTAIVTASTSSILIDGSATVTLKYF